MINVSIAGSTGSIGQQALQVAERLPQQLHVVALSAGSDWRRLAEQCRCFKPQLAAIADERAYVSLRDELAGSGVRVVAGEQGVAEAAACAASEVTLVAVSGLAGLKPLLAAMQAGKRIALANKESLVAAGQLVMGQIAARGLSLQPVDSEHSAIWQCLSGERHSEVAQLILTASGGAFRDMSAEQLQTVTAAQALRHPTWSMGAKITIDSATLVNKGLEIIEAHWLFDVPYADIRVVVHPQSIVHSLVAFRDGTLKAQLGPADMRLPIQYALLNRSRAATAEQIIDLAQIAQLDFHAPDTQRFPALDIIRRAGEQGGDAPAYINAVNEVLAVAFLQERVSYPAFITALGELQAAHAVRPADTLAAVFDADSQGREDARRVVEQCC